MIRTTLLIAITIILGFSCANRDKQSARYDAEGCPICAQITHGSCSYCYGTSHCMFCQGEKERTTVSPNIIENDAIKPFKYKEACPFCKNTGVCTYCNGSGKCWACNGTAKVDTSWKCLNKKIASK